MRHASQAQRQLGLRIHAIVFIPTIVVLLIVNLLTGSPYWIAWVVLCWGIGLVAHWLSIRLYHDSNTGTP